MTSYPVGTRARSHSAAGISSAARRQVMQDAARPALEVAEDTVAQPVGVSRVTVFAHFPGWKARGRPHRGRAQVRQPGGVILVLAHLPVTDFAAGAGSRRNSEHPSHTQAPRRAVPAHQPGPTSGVAMARHSDGHPRHPNRRRKPLPRGLSQKSVCL